jgi:hypothetical protein
VSKQAYATPLITPKVSRPSGRRTRPAGQHDRTDLPDGLTDDRHDQRDQQERADAGVALSEPSYVVVPKGTGPRRKVHKMVKPMASTPVRANASAVTGSGSSSQRFTS